MKNFVFKISGYCPEIVKAGRFGAKFLLPGLSLIIVFMTSCYGGVHLTTTLIDPQNVLQYVLCAGGTMCFTTLILVIDYTFIHGNKSGWNILIRIILAATAGFLISILTCLSIFEKDIEAARNKIIHTQTKSESQSYLENVERIRTLPDSINKYLHLSNMAHNGDLIIEGRKVGRCGAVELPQSYCQVYLSKANSFRDEYDANKYLLTDTSQVALAKNMAEEQNSNALIGQIKNLWQLMSEEPIIAVGVTLIFIFLLFADLVPISVKFGIKDQLDKDYENFINELRNDGFVDIEKKRIIKFNEHGIEEIEHEYERKSELQNIKREYFEKRMKFIIDKINRMSTNTGFAEETEVNNQEEPETDNESDDEK
ncbi:hypothetical protein [Dysgonomonas sp. 511]|uniref:hypothetical protein n=1 Tax=Dysgonomonas sp. 511 TaxID=2302930 RepID=UPI0013CFA127|nr:hypothetical protein [Dysgonomonas sp. 511]NDV79786.1 hypothetical protein [Dysgonomonas sp. 511]